jgi:hypothetical protein
MELVKLIILKKTSYNQTNFFLLKQLWFTILILNEVNGTEMVKLKKTCNISNVTTKGVLINASGHAYILAPEPKPPHKNGAVHC